MRAKLRIISSIVFVFHYLGLLDVFAQNRANDYSRLRLKLICPKREIVAGQNFEFQVVMSNSAQHLIRGAPPEYMAYLDLVIQKNGRAIPYQVACRLLSYSPPDLEIEPNRTWSWYGDLYEGNPDGIDEGNFTLFATYSPNPTNRSFKLWSNPVQLTVLRRSPEQEEQYKYFIQASRRPWELGIEQHLQFLATYSNSLWAPTITRWIANHYASRGDYDLARKTLEVIPLLPTATKPDIVRKHRVASRALKEQGYLYEALVEMETCPIPFPDDHDIKELKARLTKLYLSAQVRLEPEALKVSPGILTAHVRLPEGYPVSGITTATCDHAPAERMTVSDDGTEMIMKFRRKDIEAAQARSGKSIDTNFVVQGNWTGTVVTARGTRTSSYFWGTASIKQITEEHESIKKKARDEEDKSEEED